MSASDARPAPNSVLVWLSITLCLVAIGLATIYVVQPVQAGTEPLDIESVVATETPSTVPPITADASADALPQRITDADILDTSAARRDEVATRRTDADIGSFSELIGDTTSAIPEPEGPRPMPVSIDIDSIDVTPFPIRDVGLEDDGQLEVPDETEIGWYRYGATSGRPGATVLAAHVSWNSTTGPFFELGTVEPGNQITVTLDDGTARQYEVIERTLYDKDELPRDRIWRNTGPEELVLITCGGDFNPEIRRYRQNIVVYAVPVA